jgi:hypothetical protein
VIPASQPVLPRLPAALRSVGVPSSSTILSPPPPSHPPGGSFVPRATLCRAIRRPQLDLLTLCSGGGGNIVRALRPEAVQSDEVI